MAKLDPKNLTAQLAYRGEGNPPASHPSSAISNCFPGLEVDFRNVWRRIFAGIELHEASNLVVAVDADAPEPVRALLDHLLIAVEGQPTVVAVIGPRAPAGERTFPEPGEPDRPVETLQPNAPIEWGNALADILAKPSDEVTCDFLVPPDYDRIVTLVLRRRSFFEVNADGRPLPTISRKLLEPGELTQSLCSPWQNDYRECGCYYWAASRPDFVNVTKPTAAGGKSTGRNWLDKDRGATSYERGETKLLTYDELFREWETALCFQRNGHDSEVDGAPPTPEEPAPIPGPVPIPTPVPQPGPEPAPGTRWGQVKQILDAAIAGWSQARENRPPQLVAKHGPKFGWATKQQLLNASALGIPLIQPEVIGRPGQPGDGASANLVIALRTGIPGFGQMPSGGPFLTPEQILVIEKWINDGTPD